MIFEIVKHCTYLAKILTNKNELRPEIEKRITNVNTAYELCPLLKSQSVIRAEKIKICKTIIRPVATYRQNLMARLHGSSRLINMVESTKVNRVNSSFQWMWWMGLMGEQAGDSQPLFSVVDSLWVTHHRLPTWTSKSRPVPQCRTSCSSMCLVLSIWLLNFVNFFLIMVFKWRDNHTQLVLDLLSNQECLWNVKSENYRNRNIQDKALEEMVKQLNIPDLTQEDVKLKVK